MTENDRTDDDGTGRPIEDVPAAIHRQLSDAGIRLNEGQTHLSAVRTQAARGDVTNEIARAEAEALIHALEASREHIDEAIAMANRFTGTDARSGDGTAAETGGSETDDGAVGDGTDRSERDEQTTSEDESETESDREDDPDDGSRMLWNTVHVVAPNHPR